MTTQQLLLPFIENIDYKIENGEIIALAKIRQISQIIFHPEVAAVPGQESHGIIPATFDASGNELTPMIPAQEFVAEIPFQAAYEEDIQVDETYFQTIPSLDSFKSAIIQDMTLAISEFLTDKATLLDPENDSFNIVNNNIFSWGFVNIPQPSISELFDSYNIAVAKKQQAQINAEALKYLADTDWVVTRFAETGVSIPEEIRDLRVQARTRIV